MTDSQVILTKKPGHARKSNPASVILATSYLAEGEEYAYLYTLNGEWVCYDRHQFEENTMPTVAEIPSGALAV